MTSEWLLNMSIEVLYPQKQTCIPPKQMSGYAPDRERHVEVMNTFLADWEVLNASCGVRLKWFCCMSIDSENERYFLEQISWYIIHVSTPMHFLHRARFCSIGEGSLLGLWESGEQLFIVTLIFCLHGRATGTNIWRCGQFSFHLVHGLSVSLPLKFGITYLFTSDSHNHSPLSDVI